jgi:hypothetical protein
MKNTYIQEDLDFFCGPLAPDDSSLPRPLGWVGKKRKENETERAKLLATMILGELVPERYTPEHLGPLDTTKTAFQCPQCREIYPDQFAASRCCGAQFNRIQICVVCSQRFVDCQCGPAGHFHTKAFPQPFRLGRNQVLPGSVGKLNNQAPPFLERAKFEYNICQ